MGCRLLVSYPLQVDEASGCRLALLDPREGSNMPAENPGLLHQQWAIVGPGEYREELPVAFYRGRYPDVCRGEFARPDGGQNRYLSIYF